MISNGSPLEPPLQEICQWLTMRQPEESRNSFIAQRRRASASLARQTANVTAKVREAVRATIGSDTVAGGGASFPAT